VGFYGMLYRIYIYTFVLYTNSLNFNSKFIVGLNMSQRWIYSSFHLLLLRLQEDLVTHFYAVLSSSPSGSMPMIIYIFYNFLKFAWIFDGSKVY
jgi:hypothetical protein